MLITPGPGEPVAGPWHEAGLAELVGLLRAVIGEPAGRPGLLAVDGRSGSGKSTLADRLRRAVPRSAVVHTDDIAWHHSAFGWADLLSEQVLVPLRRGQSVTFRPPGWTRRGRPGAIEVAAGLDLVVVEGVGASRLEVADLLDASIWVQSDYATAERLGLARDVASGVNGNAEATTAFWHAWMAEELEFLDRQRPWERATVAVAGVVADAPGADSPRSAADADRLSLAPAVVRCLPRRSSPPAAVPNAHTMTGWRDAWAPSLDDLLTRLRSG